MELELIIGLLTGPAAGIAVAVYFLNRFMSFQKDVTERLIVEIKEDRSIFEDTIKKIDARLTCLETLIEHFIKKGD